MDAAEIARLREEGDTFVSGFEKMHALCGYAEYRLNAYHVVALIAERRALIDALEQAQKERDDCFTALKRVIVRWTELHSVASDAALTSTDLEKTMGDLL